MLRHTIKLVLAISSLIVAPSANADVGKEYGTYPNCNPPAVPLEVHSWWHENGEMHPRHLHLAACIPNARDTTGNLVSFSGRQLFTSRILAFNNPGEETFTRWAWESDVMENVRSSYQCQHAPDQMVECRWPVTMILAADLADSGGLHELRLTPNVEHADLGTRQFATLNYQVYLKNGRSARNYRSTPDPIARSWYTGSGYVNVKVDYMSSFTRLDQAIPTVGGVVPIKLEHTEGSFTVTSLLFQDPDFHAYPNAHTDPRKDPTGKTKLLYKQPGRFDGTFYWDTRVLSNGIHVLYAQTEDEGPNGIHAAALRLLYNVQN